MWSMVLRWTVVMVALGAMLPASAREKDNTRMMPPYILRARTVAILIDPAAAVSLRDPNGNQTARKDVETALLKWGRFEPILDARDADLVILIRKGRSAADVAVPDTRQNRRGGMVDPWEDGIAVGVQRGTVPNGPPAGRSAGQPATTPDDPTGDRPVKQDGTPVDVFQVFDGRSDDPLNGVPGWSYVKKDALHAHDVPAVEEFRKAIDAAEKQAGQAPKKHP